MRSPTRATVLLAIPLLAACSDMFGDKPGQLGTPLGTYHVVGHLSATTCGADALGATDPWEFDMQLSRDADVLFWKNGAEDIRGTVATDGTFTFQSSTAIPVREQKGAMVGCTIGRSDTASGKLDGKDTDVPSFSGTLTYQYAATQQNNCAGYVGNGPGTLAQLPCSMTYAIAATRTSTTVTQR